MVPYALAKFQTRGKLLFPLQERNSKPGILFTILNHNDPPPKKKKGIRHKCILHVQFQLVTVEILHIMGLPFPAFFNLVSLTKPHQNISQMPQIIRLKISPVTMPKKTATSKQKGHPGFEPGTSDYRV